MNASMSLNIPSHVHVLGCAHAEAQEKLQHAKAQLRRTCAATTGTSKYIATIRLLQIIIKNYCQLIRKCHSSNLPPRVTYNRTVFSSSIATRGSAVMYFDPSQWPWSAALAHKEPRPQLHGAVVMSSGLVQGQMVSG